MGSLTDVYSFWKGFSHCSGTHHGYLGILQSFRTADRVDSTLEVSEHCHEDSATRPKELSVPL